ncbi:dTMP kinase [Adlercreutzia sp. ZJ242]|uniref:dTMP kinase n=1 Tax=Adlercreutzia sp. ZJ242 TaxID=2709409 RepID=UPI001F14C47B|nr:dTMP kinase [Adlercreutzia sp. ZJ242]
MGMTASAPSSRGVFVTFEGGDGAGKTTHIGFLADALEERGAEVVRLREPGGTPVGEALRAVVLDPAHESLADEAELLIYEAARAQIVAEVIEPALERGAVVLCDRFLDSTVAYQAFGRGLDRAFVDAANRFSTRGIMPDRTLLMTCGGPEEGLVRVGARRAAADRLEQAGAAFHERVAAGFAAIAQEDSARVRVISSDGPRSVTAAMIFHALSDLFPWMADARICDEEYFAVLDVPGGRAAGATPRASQAGATSRASQSPRASRSSQERARG